MANTTELENQAAYALSSLSELPTRDKLLTIVSNLAGGLGMIPTNDGPYTEGEVELVVRALQTKFDTRMNLGAIFEAEDYRPWLAQRQGDIPWYYWDRYKAHLLTERGFPPPVVRTLDQVTDKILDHLEDPSKPGQWTRRGLVVGHVQSGKTANYTGVIAKASDAGYRVVIVLAGLLNSLRNQTQERIDSDFMGWSTTAKEFIGSAKHHAGDSPPRHPICFTTSIEDFKKNTAKTIAMGLEAVNEPVVLILKKNKTTLENLYTWLSEQNPHNLKDCSMLMIDDEADHASVNTNKGDKDPTAINLSIRNLLSLFGRSSFVGYTATPFANIFIDPDNEDEMSNGDAYRDLFPRDFILSLDPPSNYVGPDRLFLSNSDLDCIRPINDNEDILPIKHKIDHAPVALPRSFEKAINCFILARAIRLFRGQKKKHHSMMINASRFVGVQELLRGLVLERVKDIRHAIGNYAALSREQALGDSTLAELYRVWNEEYSASGVEWDDIQKILKESVDPIEVISVNGNSPLLSYSSTEYPNGRSIIAVGGLGLSRGLTLEGLLVSYFLRNSIMYDTLMQMGRWFGYRDGYDDICRIFMTDDAAAWYTHITEATEELREDFKKMERSKLTPIDFGLRVRSHPASLIVTARNKMRTGTSIPHRIALEGRLIETLALSANPKINDDNLELCRKTVTRAETEFNVSREKTSLGYLWKGVPSSLVQSFIEEFVSPQASFYTFHHEALSEHLRWISETNSECDLLLKTLKPSADDPPLWEASELTGRIQSRDKTAHEGDGIISFKKNSRMGEPRDEEAGATEEEIAEIRRSAGGGTVNPRLYRNLPNRKPLLILHLIELKKPFEVACGYGLSFPGESTTRKPKKLVEYVVNIPYWKNAYLDLSSEDDSEEDEA